MIGLNYYTKHRYRGHNGMNSFWHLNVARLDFILYDAHKLWLQGMKHCNGDTERAYMLNGAWDRVERMFAEHGYFLYD